MSGSEFVVEPDRWALPRREVPAVRGPLKTVPRRHARPLWPLGIAVSCLSLALAFALAFRPAPAPVEPAPLVVAETQPAPRVVGAAEVPVPAAVLAVVEPPEARPKPEPAVSPSSPSSARPAAPALDVRQLPVLQLDAAAFDAVPGAEAPQLAPAKPPARHAAPRAAAQP